MAHRDFLIRYSNGFKRHISRAERDLLLDSLEQIGPREYLSTATLQATIEQAKEPSYLSGRFIFELHGKKRIELMQSVAGLVRQMRT